MSDDSIDTAPRATPSAQIAVSPNNPCPFLRALVANGYVGGHVVPLSQIAEMVGLASGETGSAQKDVRRKTMFVAAIANGIGPLSVLKNATSGACCFRSATTAARREGACIWTARPVRSSAVAQPTSPMMPA